MFPRHADLRRRHAPLLLRLRPHVQAVGAQRVRSRDGQILRVFAPGERIFMEQSRKFSLEAMQRLAAGAGLELARHWTNRDKYHLIVELVLPGTV